MLRKEMQQLRIKSQNFQQEKIKQLNRNIIKYIKNSCSKNQILAFFWPLKFEPDIYQSLIYSVRKTYSIVLPKTLLKGQALEFYQWYPKAPMHMGFYKTFYPNTIILHPDVIFLPLLAFDRNGNRLGYGGGYYDRTLAIYPRAITVGIAYSYQEKSKIPIDKFDYQIDMIITEKEIIHSLKV